MQLSLRRLVREILGYAVGLGTAGALGVVAALIYPIVLSQGQYGSSGVVSSLSPVLSLLFFLGFEIALGRLYYQHDDPAWRGRLAATAFYTVMSVTVLGIAVLLSVSAPLALILYNGDAEYILYFRLALAGIPFIVLNGFQLLILRLERRIAMFNVLSIVNQVIGPAVAIATIRFAGLGAAGVFVGILAGYAVTSVAGTLINWRRLWHPPLPDQLREMLRMGLPLVFYSVPQWVLQASDRLFLVHSGVSKVALGHYEIANGIVALLGLGITAFRNAWQPFAFSVMGREHSERVYARALTFLAAIGATITAAVALFAPEGLAVIGWITGKDWQAAAPTLGPLALSSLFFAMYFVMQTGALISKRTSAITWAMIVAALADTLFNILLIPPLGIVGAAAATALGYFTAFAVMYVLAQRLSYIPYEMGKVLAAVLACVAVVAAAMPLNSSLQWSTGLLKAGLLALFGLMLLAARVVTVSEIRVAGNGLMLRLRAALAGRRK